MNDGTSAEASGERAVAAGRDIGSVSTGDFVTQVERATLLPAEALDFTGRLCHLPQRTEQFVGRTRELDLLDRALADTSDVAVHAVHGLGGVGKSTLAARWAAGHATEYNPLWWITADSSSAVDAGLAALGRALQPALVGVLTDEALRERVLQWLSSHEGWLLILDNVSDPADIRPLLARTPGGRFLITTRLSATTWRGATTALRLDVLEPTEAVDLFTRVHSGPPDGVGELCAELGRLPLAVDQAAAYCREAGVSPRGYLDLLLRWPSKMFAASAEGGDGQRTVARVWQVTLEHLDETPTATGILRTIAWWAPEEIPRAYLDGIADPFAVTEGIRRLAAYSMITLREDTLSVHRLVQASARAADPELALRHRDHAARVLGRARVEGPAWGPAARLWATHVEALASRAPAESDTAETADLLNKAALYLAGVDPSRSADLSARGAASFERVGGTDSPAAAGARLLTGLAHTWQGDFVRACPLFEEQLTRASRLFGADHPSTFWLLCLTLSVKSRIDPAGARALVDETVTRAERALGRDHSHVHRRRTQLSVLAPPETESGDAGARLAVSEGLLGVNSWELMPLRRSLLTELAARGDFRRAVAVVEEMVYRCRSVLGSTDGVTLVLRIEQISLLLYAGKAERAGRLLPDLVDDWAEVMGDAVRAWRLSPYLALLSSRPEEA
ncbi:tetratricopeptide repeat protein [Streptomyces sp. NPDC046716]|uniref:tetratricopeptide repeat protein n=1 Tax=Streptomyces sp. NPDC046716 TaxID=3157093 RepID=UPI0033DFEB1A